jgi:hypothetical protein
MSYPIQPTSQPSTPPVPSTEPDASPSDAEIRALATQLADMADPGITPAQYLKGVVTATDYSTMTATITLEGSTSTIAGVKIDSGATAVVGDVVNVIKQGTALLIVSRSSALSSATDTLGGWIKPTLGSGFTHNGNSEGDIQYRLVNDNGDMRMDWQGCAAISGTPTALLGSALATSYRPSAKRRILVNGVFVVFGTDGTVTLDTSAFPAHVHSLGTSGGGGDVHDHSHAAQVQEVSFVETHVHAMGSSTGTTSGGTPSFLSFHGVFYYL